MSSKDVPSLDGFIQTKGAGRPEAMQQRGASQPAPSQVEAPQTNMQARPTQSPEPRAKALTLRLSESQYQRLRRFAFDRGLSHQDVLEQALMELLGEAGA